MLEDVKNVEQSVTFYNVTGYIEKENRIYFAPLNKQLVANAQAGTTKPLCQWYKDYFDSVVGILSSRYQNVSISRWSPSDRTLSVQGTIDLFRKSGVSSDSKAFNYMIVKRIVTGVTSQDASINYTYYMGYFITDVQQSGTNTVRLTLDIDNFTNAFYLMNTQQYSDSELLNLDIFNSTLVNCNVERQHYNRVKLVDGEVKIDNNEIFLNPLESYDYKYQKKVSKSPILVNGVEHTYTNYLEQDITGQGYNPDYANLVAGREYIVNPRTIVATEWTISFTYSSYGQDNVVHIRKRYKSGASKDEIISAYSPVLSITIQPSNPTVLRVMWYNSYAQDSQLVTIDLNSNDYYVTLQFGSTQTLTASESNLLPLFHNIVNYLSFTYTLENNFTNEELEIIKQDTSWTNLTPTLRKKIILSCISFALIKTKEPITYCYGSGDYAKSSTSFSFQCGFKPNKIRGLASGNTDDTLYNYMLPIIVINKLFNNYESIIKSLTADIYSRAYLIYKTSASIVEETYSTQYTNYSKVREDIPLLYLGEEGTAGLNTSELLLGYMTKFSSLSGLLGSDFADVILSASIVKDFNCPYIDIIDTSTSPKIRINCNVLGLAYQESNIGVTFNVKSFNYFALSHIKLPKGLWINFVPNSRKYIVEPTADDDDELRCLFTGAQTSDGGCVIRIKDEGLDILPQTKNIVSANPTAQGIIFQLSGYNPQDITIYLEETDKYLTLSEDFYDPILENNPYTFYSVSYTAGLESPFNKQKYASSYNDELNAYVISLLYIYSNNDAQKVGLIVNYDFEGNSYPYYTDSLIFTLSAQLPNASDSYASYFTQNRAQMKNQYAVDSYIKGVDLAQYMGTALPRFIGSYLKGGSTGVGAQFIADAGNITDQMVDWFQSNNVIGMNQRALLAGAGSRPDTIKQAGSDVYFDIDTGEMGIYLNYYRIDDFSYNSIAKGLERYGYLVNRYDTLHVADRVGWNYVKLISADFNHYGAHLNLTTEQESDIMDIFKEGVTLLHSPEYLYNQSLHNHETLIDIDD